MVIVRFTFNYYFYLCFNFVAIGTIIQRLNYYIKPKPNGLNIILEIINGLIVIIIVVFITIMIMLNWHIINYYNIIVTHKFFNDLVEVIITIRFNFELSYLMKYNFLFNFRHNFTLINFIISANFNFNFKFDFIIAKQGYYYLIVE